MSRTRLFFRRWQNWLSLILILAYVFAAVGAPYLSPHDPKEPGPFMRIGWAFESRPLPPDETAILGMLPRGIDVYHALVWGSRDALRFGLIVTVFSSLFGIVYGAVSGYLGGRVGGVVLLQATLTFIGLGADSVWGTMLSDGRNWVLGPGGNLLTYWWVFLPPTLAVILFGIAWNIFGDGLSDLYHLR